MRFTSELRQLVRLPGYPPLLGVRMLSQFSDGVFQVALAGAVVFSPEKAPDARSIAAAFATILLPFSVLGPFVGVFLDRWSRCRILIFGNLLRSLLALAAAWLAREGELGPAFFAVVLCAFSINRFVMSGLSASLPHVVSARLLVSANSLTPTCGTLSYVLGMGAGTLIRSAASDVVVLLCAAGTYFAGMALAYRLPFLGPELADASTSVRRAVGHVVTGMIDAVRHLNGKVRLALLTVGIVRLPFGIMTTAMILLSRHEGSGRHAAQGLAGLGFVAVASGIGFALAMVLTPGMVVRLGLPKTIVLLLGCAAVFIVFPSSLFTHQAIAAGALGVGWTTQGIKICLDTLVQTQVADVFLGRVFAFYDMVFNAALVIAVTLAASVLPPDGRSLPVMFAAGAWYLLGAAFFTFAWRRRDAREPDPDPMSRSVPSTS